MPPVGSWGKHHGLVPFHAEAKGYRVTVLASQDNTLLYVGLTAFSLNAGLSVSADVLRNGYLTVKSSKPVMVAQTIIVPEDNTVDAPSSVIVPATVTYHSFYAVLIPSRPGHVSHAMLVIPEGQETNFIFENVSIETGWTLLTSQGGENYVGTTVEVPPGKYFLATTNNVRFGVTIYIVGQECAFSYSPRSGWY